MGLRSEKRRCLVEENSTFSKKKSYTKYEEKLYLCHEKKVNHFQEEKLNLDCLTESNDKIGRDPFKQFPVNFSSSIVWTEAKKKQKITIFSC